MLPFQSVTPNRDPEPKNQGNNPDGNGDENPDGGFGDDPSKPDNNDDNAGPDEEPPNLAAVTPITLFLFGHQEPKKGGGDK
jgi:hypothetical protein